MENVETPKCSICGNDLILIGESWCCLICDPVEEV